MYTIRNVSRLVQEARQHADLTQRDLAERVGTSQSAIAKLEQGATNPTIDTLARCVAAAGFELRIELVPLPRHDPVVERYKQDVDRTLLRENRRKPMDERVRTLAEWQNAGRALQHATREARRRRR
jgi:transcriptional regulator with XRE-family HTH domain